MLRVERDEVVHGWVGVPLGEGTEELTALGEVDCVVAVGEVRDVRELFSHCVNLLVYMSELYSVSAFRHLY
jgi:hypothetical protein